MVQLAHDGLELWYGTPDAPAPDGTTEQRQGVSVTVGVRPANPSNAVSVRYRVDGRGVETVSAPLVASDFQKRTQYFRATFPTFWSGETVEYVPVVSCEGRRAPDPATAGSFPSSFRLGEASPAPRLSPQRPFDSQAVFPVRLEHVARARVAARERAGVLRRYTGRLCRQLAPRKWHPRRARIAYQGHSGREAPDDYPRRWDRHPQCQRDGRDA